MPDVLLLNVPWSRATQPALGISLLKAILQGRSIQTDVVYLNLRWTERLHQSLADLLPPRQEPCKNRFQRWVRDLCLQYTADLACEWTFAQAIYGEGSLDAEKYIRSVLPKRFSAQEVDVWVRVRSLTREFLLDCSRSIAWDRYKLLGFTCFVGQAPAAIRLAQLIKERHPGLPIIFGGPNCQGPLGAALLRNFQSIDYIADGEADEIFPKFVERICAGRSVQDLPGILRREAGQVVGTGHTTCVEDLSSLPPPDLSDYFEQLRQIHVDPPIEARVATHHSRGCWWGERSKCLFCGYDDGVIRYRSRDGEAVAAEAASLATRYQADGVCLAESILHWRSFQSLVPALEKQSRRLNLFVECKSNLKREQIRALHRAGFAGIQPGIESFSSRVLRLMKKGVTALQNVECLKWCDYYRLSVFWNLLCGIPGETPEDYEDTLRIVRSLTHLSPPLYCGRILLLRFSELFDRAEEYGLINVRPREPYPHIYAIPPEELSQLSWSFDFDYADGRVPEDYTAELSAFVKDWQESAAGSLLHVDKDDGWGRILDRRFNRKVDALDLNPFENRVYRLCDSTVSRGRLLGKLAAEFGGEALEDRLDRALARFQELQMMTSEGESLLSVAHVEPAASDDVVGDEDWLTIGA